MRFTAVAAGCIAAALAFTPVADTQAASTKPLTLATGAMTAGRINPYDSISITRAWLFAALYDTLTYVDSDGKLISWLATAWQPASPTEWLFDLRRDVVFSNGAPFTAADVVRAVEYLIGPDGRTEPAAPFAANIKSATAIDAHKVKITTLNPDPTLPQRLSLIRIATLPEGMPFTRENLINSAIGTGPYTVETWALNKATFVAAPQSWRKAPTPALHAIALPDAAARKSAVMTGAVDVAFAAFDFAESDLPTGGKYVLADDHIPAVVGLAFNTTKDTPFQDIRVRQAIIGAVNVKAIVSALFSGRATLAQQPARHEFLGFNPDVPATVYDPEKSKRLLNDAGLAKGFTFSLAMTQGGTIWGQVFQMVASDLNKIGVTMKIEALPDPVMAGMIYNTGVKADAMAAVFFSPSFDALDAVRQHTCSWTVAWFCDPEAEKLRESAVAAKTLDARIDLTKQLMARMHENAQALFMYESLNLVSYSSRIKNFRSDFGFLRYDLMQVED
ncbi:MAG: ABC transporter substrate-binding protein [Rhodospirillaceae bacterium]|nr:ABC transporter substrate-binding protein [Rhodospirillaceae bacterium]